MLNCHFLCPNFEDIPCTRNHWFIQSTHMQTLGSFVEFIDEVLTILVLAHNIYIWSSSILLSQNMVCERTLEISMNPAQCSKTKVSNMVMISQNAIRMQPLIYHQCFSHHVFGAQGSCYNIASRKQLLYNWTLPYDNAGLHVRVTTISSDKVNDECHFWCNY